MSWGSERNFRIKYGHASTCRKVDRFRGRYILHPTRECNCKDANGEFKTPLPYDEIRRYGLEPAAGNAREMSRLRAILAQAEEALDAIENLCALNPRLAGGEVHHTAMCALAAVREGRK